MPEQSIFTQRTGHPYQVDLLVEMPDGLRQSAEAALPADDPVRMIFIHPPQTVPKKFGSVGGMRPLPEQALLFTEQGVLYVLGSRTPGGAAQSTYLRGADLLYVQLIQVLLYGKLEFCGGSTETPTQIVLEYNSVRHDLIQPWLYRLLSLATGLAHPTETAASLDDALVDELGVQSFKFRNGYKELAQQPGDRLLGFAFQPRIMKHFGGFWHWIELPASLIALTESELILIEEGRTNATSYGWFITFCPRVCVAGVETVPSGERQDVCVHLRRGALTADRHVTVENEAAQAWQAVWSSQAHIVPVHQT
jgi:hypothetical protein